MHSQKSYITKNTDEIVACVMCAMIAHITQARRFI